MREGKAGRDAKRNRLVSRMKRMKGRKGTDEITGGEQTQEGRKEGRRFRARGDESSARKLKEVGDFMARLRFMI